MARPTADQPDLFLSALADVPWRDQIDLMAVPIVSLAKGKRAGPIIYRRGDVVVEVSAPVHIGIATIWDLDLVLWAISQINAAINRREATSATIRAVPYDVLRSIHRGTSGREYQRLREALDRLVATTVRTTVRAKAQRGETFSLLERVAWEEDDKGRLVALAVTVPGWLFKAVMDRQVLAVDPRYFTLTSGLARWFYRVARKQAGDNVTGWRWTMADLHERSGVTRPLKGFAFDIRRLVEADALPEYHATIYSDAHGGEAVHVVRRSRLAHDHAGREPRVRRNALDPA